MNAPAKRRPGTPFNRPDVDPFEALAECADVDRTAPVAPISTVALFKLRQQIRDRSMALVRGLIAPCSRATLYRLMNDDAKPRLDLAARIEKHLGIRALDWFERVDGFQSLTSETRTERKRSA